ncbi:MAG: Recombinase [Clostridia bacterium]|nr:Recombinase [Clostridia bacterium]
MDFKAGLYLRLSREDDNKEEDLSESIKNQRSFLLSYAQQKNFTIVDTYIDDGYSGTNFDRPAFKEMLKDIENGRINTVITKDMSRLGRDYITTGYYIEKYFPEHNVRYIAVNDNMDSYDGSGNDIAPFKSVINDMYAKDISQKVRAALDVKKKNGKFIGSYAPYGYKKDDKNRNKLIIDNETAPYVQMLFKMCLQGDMLLEIANKLSAQGIPTPAESKNLTISPKRFKGVWNDVIIKRILTNPTYIGNLTQNRTKKINYKLKKRIHLPREQWISTEGTHEAIIDTKTFEAVQHILKSRTYKTEKHGPNLLTGLVFCADCQSPMCIMRDGPRTYLACSTWRKHGKLNLCTSHTIREETVITEVLKVFKQLSDEFINIHKLETECSGSDNIIINNTTQAIAQIRHKLEVTQKALLDLYKDKATKVITTDEYIQFTSDLKKEKAQYESQIYELEKDLQQKNNMNDVNELIEEFLSFKEIDRNILLLLVSKIYIHKDKTIEIQFTFTKPD